MNAVEMAADYNWRAAFEEATREIERPFSVDDVAEVIAAADGEHDGAHWVCVVRLRDWRFASVNAWCDYTGWDCQAGGIARTAATLDELVRWHVTAEDRARLGLPAPVGT